MKRVRLAFFIVVLGAASIALATPTLRLGASQVSSVIYPAQDLRLDFDHARHVNDQNLDCVDCHDLARESRSPNDILLPREERCVACHADTTRPEGQGPAIAEDRCRVCHPGDQDRIIRSEIPPSRLVFSHAQHVEQGCESCHSRVALRRLATADDLPHMQTCLTCHREQGESTRCSTCHLIEPDARLRTHFGAERLQPAPWMWGAQHGPDWVDEHEQIAPQRLRLCENCHQQHECIACHDGNVRPREVHPGDWMTAHAIEARGGELRCRSCHRGQSFCRTCHLRAGVSRRSPLGRIEGTDHVVHHEPNWASSATPTHGPQARRALQTCVSCHVGQDCVTCHISVNPHGPGFRQRCRSLVRAGSRACITCHGTAEGLCE